MLRTMAYAVVKQSLLKRWGGKLTLGAAGAVVGGPLGALLGAVAGHAYDRYRKALQHVEAVYASVDNPQETKHTAQEAAFTIGVIALGAKLAQDNRYLGHDAVEHFRTTFGLPAENAPLIKKMFEQTFFDKHSFRPYAEHLASLFKQRDGMLEALISGLVRFARTERDELTASTHDYLRQLAAIFGLSEARFVQLLAAQGVTRSDQYRVRDAFAILGVAPHAPEQVVKQSYRALLQQHHPDRLQQQGLAAAELAAANDRVATLNAAYAEIKRVRGWV